MKKEYLDDYVSLWRSVEINTQDKSVVTSQINKILKNKDKYQKAGNDANIPWYIIACIHSLESSLNFTKHLHNGDPLTSRTVKVPAGRPESGNPPFSWEVSAADAMSMKIQSGWPKSDVEKARNGDSHSTLYLLECYNGLGYRKYHPEVKTPYLWSKTNKYTKGKYTSDGKFDPEATSAQIGAAALLKALAERGEMSLSAVEPELEISVKPIIHQGASEKAIKSVQNYMNHISRERNNPSSGIEFNNGPILSEDGKVGPKTLNRFKEVFGFDMVP